MPVLVRFKGSRSYTESEKELMEDLMSKIGFADDDDVWTNLEVFLMTVW